MESSFDICYAVSKSLGLTLIDIRGENNSWYRFKDDMNKNILIKYVKSNFTSVSFDNIDKLFDNVEKIIIISNDRNQYIMDELLIDNNLIGDNIEIKGYIKLIGSEAKFYPINKLEITLTITSRKIESLTIKDLSLMVSRYKSILKRNYLQNLQYLLFENYKEDIDCNSLKITSTITSELKKKYQDLYLEMKEVRDRNKKLSDKSDSEKNQKKLKCEEKLFEEYTTHYQSKILSFNDFDGIWNTERKCAYCGVSETQIKEGNLNIQTKRFYSRGKTMEIDKKDAFGEYTKDNIILSCYWCNNAKTDEFELDEFKCIAKGIHTAWEKRLKENDPLAKIAFPFETYEENRDECE